MTGSVNSGERDHERARQVAHDGLILRGLVGSTVHGLSNPGTDDRDEMGVCIEPPEYVIGLRGVRALRLAHAARGRAVGPGRPRPHDLRPAQVLPPGAEGQPDGAAAVLHRGRAPAGAHARRASGCRRSRRAFLSKRTGHAFLGYLEAQRRSLLGERHATRTRELSAEHGYDTKYAMHALRIAVQGIELLSSGRISLPVPEPDRGRLRAVRAGSVPLDEVVARLDDLTERLERLTDESELPPAGDQERWTGSSWMRTGRPGDRGSAPGGAFLHPIMALADRLRTFADARIARLAAAQHGVVALRQLRANGIGSGAIYHRVRCGRLHPVHRGVFAVGHARLTREGRWMAAVLALGEGAVLSHVSAAALWRLRASAASRIHVTVPTTAGREQRPGIVVHRCRVAAPGGHERVDGIAVTTVARTLLDIAGMLAPGPLRASRRAVAHPAAVRHARAARAHRRRSDAPGRAVLERIVTTIHDEPAITRSDLEALMRDLCDAAGIPRPQVNMIVEGEEVDFVWREQRLIVETDGHATHGTRAAFERDRARDARLTMLGYRVVRFTHRQLTYERDQVAATLDRLAGGPRRRSCDRPSAPPRVSPAPRQPRPAGSPARTCPAIAAAVAGRRSENVQRLAP